MWPFNWLFRIFLGRRTERLVTANRHTAREVSERRPRYYRESSARVSREDFRHQAKRPTEDFEIHNIRPIWWSKEVPGFGCDARQVIGQDKHGYYHSLPVTGEGGFGRTAWLGPFPTKGLAKQESDRALKTWGREQYLREIALLFPGTKFRANDVTLRIFLPLEKALLSD